MKIIFALCLALGLAACSGNVTNRGNHPAPCDPQNPPTCIYGPGGAQPDKS